MIKERDYRSGIALPGSMRDSGIEKKYYYTWRGRHWGVYYMLWLFLIFVLFLEVMALFHGAALLNFNRGYLYSLGVVILVGLLADRVSTTGVLKSYHMVGLGEDVLTIQITKDERALVPWSSITKIEDFDIRDLQVLDPVNKSPDFWVARCVSGFRVFTEDGRIYRIYRTLKHYKEVRAEVIRKAPHAALLKNGKPVNHSGGCADLGHVHLYVWVVAHDRARGARVVEVDVREQQVPDVVEVEPTVGEPRLERRERRRRPDVEQGRAVVRLERVRGDAALDPGVQQVDGPVRAGAVTPRPGLPPAPARDP